MIDMKPATINKNQPQYEVSDDDTKRQKAIELAWKAYHGDLDPPLERLKGDPDDNVMSNRCQPAADGSRDFLFGKEIEIVVEDAAPKEAQQVLDKTWGRKEVRVPLLQRLAMHGAMAGHAFLRIVPNYDGTFRLVTLDPMIVFVQTAPQDIETVLLYCIEYSCSEKMNGKPVNVYYHEEITRVDNSALYAESDGYEDENADGLDLDVYWSMQHWTRVGEKGDWIPAGDPIVWPYPFPPIFGCQNLPYPRDYWGMPDISPDIIGLNNALNLVQSNINRVGKIYGAPMIWAKGVGEAVLDVKPGRVTVLPTPESAMGAVPIVSDVANAQAFAQNLRSDIDEQTKVPGIATGRLSAMPRGDLSGVAIELLFLPLNKKTDTKRCLYGKLIIDVSKAVLVMAGLSEDIDVSIAWTSPLPHDDLPAAQTAVAKLGIGVSKATLQRELGYDPDEEAALNAADATSEALDQQQQQPATNQPMQLHQGMPMDNSQQPQGGATNG